MAAETGGARREAAIARSSGEDRAEVVGVGPKRVTGGDYGERCRVVIEVHARSFGMKGGRGARGGAAEIEGIVGISSGRSGGGEGEGRVGPGTQATGVRIDEY